MTHGRRSRWSAGSLLAALVVGPLAAITPPPIGTRFVADAELREAIFAVSVNGASATDSVVVLRGPNNSFYVTAASLTSWRLKRPISTLERGGVEYYLLNAISGLKIKLDDATQTLSLTARPEDLGLTRLAYPAVEIGEELAGGTGGFLNYDVTGQIADGATTLGGALEAGVFTRFGVGIANFVGRWSENGAELIRLDTSWTIDDAGRMRSIRLGDAISRGGVGGTPLRFGGIQLARNFGIQPGFVTIPLPALHGSAGLPSVVDIYVNNALRGSRPLPAGPFEITEIPIVTGTGDVQLVVRDLLGREALYTQSYYAAPGLLRKGLDDYSYEVGFIRKSFGLASNDYGPLMASATHRYGLSDNLTGEVHAEASLDMQLAGTAAGLSVPGVGLAEISLAGSHSDLGLGALAGVSFERRSRNISFGIRAEFTSAHFSSMGLGEGRRPPATTLQAFAGLPTRFGSLGVTYLRRAGRDESDAEYVSANYLLRLGRFGSLHLAGRKSLIDDKSLAAELFLSVPLGGSASATAGTALDGGGRTLRATLQKGLPVGDGLGYRLSASTGATDRLDGKLSLNTGYGEHEAHLTWIDGKSGVRLSTGGGFGLIGGQAFASRRLNHSFASVQVGAYPNVRVYAENQLIGRTGKDGSLTVPRLRAYDQNRLRIELADLPWNAEVSGDERIVRPFDRHGVAVDFEVRPATDGLLRIQLADGSPLPTGAIVRVGSNLKEFIVAQGGEVYLTGLAPENRVVASWSAGRCAFEFRYVQAKEPQPKLGNFRCRRVVQ